MKQRTLFTLLLVFAFLANASAQLKINSSGEVKIETNSPYKLDVEGDARVSGNLISTNNNGLTFKVNSVPAGLTGSTSYRNASFGYGALNSLTGGGNVAIGIEALYVNAGNYNTANGHQALRSNQNGTENIANGFQALYSNTTGNMNSANGVHALYSNTTGGANTANGYCALYSNTEGGGNTANGFRAFYSNITGNHNTAIGYDALYSNTTGSSNTAIGFQTLYTNSTGNYNTAIGYGANVSANNLGNATAIGWGATATASNQVRIGNTSVNSIGGQVAWSNLSDGRAKKNIRANVPGLAFINSLQPVTYNLDLDAMDDLLKIDKTRKNNSDTLALPLPQELIERERATREAQERRIHTGFVAQDVEKTAKSIGYDFSGVDMDESGVYALRYSEFVVPLVKAVQELSEQNDRLLQKIEMLEKKIEGLKK